MITAKTIGTGGLGRFGNQLFTISGVIGIAIKSGQPYGFPVWKNFDNALFGDEITDFSQVFVNPLPSVIEGLHFREYGYFWDYRDIKLPEGNWSIDAHMQDERYFKHCIEVVREQFRMKEEPEQNDFCAIHWRAGDYQVGKDSYHPRQEREYYDLAMKRMPEGTKYLIFSDDRIAAAEMFKGVDAPIVNEGNYLKNWRLMKRCKHFIIANSSFSLMAAILGEHHEKIIVCPSLWFGNVADLSFDGYPENSIII